MGSLNFQAGIRDWDPGYDADRTSGLLQWNFAIHVGARRGNLLCHGLLLDPLFRELTSARPDLSI